MARCGRQRKLRFLLIALGLGLVPVAGAQVSNFNENRLLNSWFEIARLPNKSQRTCVANSSNLITRGETKGELRWLWVCTDTLDNTQTHLVSAKPTGVPGTGSYRARVLWLVWHHNYQVVDVAADNSWMVLGTPNRKKLWIYSAKPKMDAMLLSELRSRAEHAGYNTSRLITQPQTNPAKSATATELK